MSTDTRPRLRRNLRFHRHESEGVISWVVKDPTALSTSGSGRWKRG
jgi:hypothetical protein